MKYSTTRGAIDAKRSPVIRSIEARDHFRANALQKCDLSIQELALRRTGTPRRLHLGNVTSRLIIGSALSKLKTDVSGFSHVAKIGKTVVDLRIKPKFLTRFATVKPMVDNALGIGLLNCEELSFNMPF